MFKNFIAEIKARKIRKWLAIHISTSLTLIGAVNLLSSRYGFPSFIFDSTLTLALGTLPITIIFAWLHTKDQQRTIKKIEIFIYSIIILFTSYIIYRIIIYQPDNSIQVAEKSIAVLPFQNFSDSRDDEFFSDGITDDILTQLSKVHALKVISRTSVMQYKNTQKSIREIAKELGVESILEGSVRRSGDRIRIVGQLIDARNDKHLWAETYDRKLNDIFEIQSEVAEKIASALTINLTLTEKERIQKKPTDNIEAYTFYLKGKDYYYRLTPDANETAIDFFKKALNSDPDYALAYAGLGKAYAQKFRLFGMGNEWYDSSKAMSEKAIQLDPDLAEPYLALGLTLFYSGKIKDALEQDLKAVNINPNSEAISSIGQEYNLLGNYSEAVPWLKESIKLDPTRWLGYRNLGQVYYALGRYDEAEKLYLKVLDLMPELNISLFDLTRLYIIQHKYTKADSLLQKVLLKSPENGRILYSLGELKIFSGKLSEAKIYLHKIIKSSVPMYGETSEYAFILWKEGKLKEAENIFTAIKEQDEQAIKDGMENHNYPYELVRIYSVEGDKDKSIKHLKLSVKLGWTDYLYAKADPLLENIKGDIRFIKIMDEIKRNIEVMNSNIR